MRCFLAIELPDAVQRRLAEVQARLRHLDRLVRWTPPGQIHLTLHFLGDVPDGQVAVLCETAQSIARGRVGFEMEIRGVGCFPQQGPPRVIWAGLTDPPAELFACHAALGAAFAELRYPPEQRAYHPHLTLARTRDRAATQVIRPALRELASFSAGRFSVHELVLFQSILGASGATHVPLVRAALAG